MSHLNGALNGHPPQDAPPLKNLTPPETTGATHQPPATGNTFDAFDGTPRRLKLTPASAVRLRPVRWLWADRIPAGALTLIPGREGIGKSLILAWLTARLTRGELPGLHQGTPRPVIYAATEDSWEHTIGPRLHAAGADLEKVFRVDVERPGGFDQLTLPRDCDELAEVITEIGVSLLAADPLLSLISSQIDSFKDQQLRTALEPLVRLADTTGCSVVGLAHFNKSANTDALNLITGSRAFSAVARAVLAIARDPQADDGSCVLSQAKNNLGRLDLPSLRYVVSTAEVATEEGPAYVGKLDFTGESDRSVDDILAEGSGDPSERAERDEAALWLTGYLTGQPNQEATALEVFQEGSAAGFSRDQLKRAKAKARVASRKSDFGGGWVWALHATGSAKGAKSAKGAAL
ncbi:AAA family ATPase [Spongiactinospora rosea]|uniref:AAA family ATPase n=1 Tax=Spongiactinospora rosea TaxID=2248750 RepID=UPI0018F5D427|nr:AAA family ATPase [Spongiactinospora rosea]